jgi:hypothetical protein
LGKRDAAGSVGRLKVTRERGAMTDASVDASAGPAG